ncbi:tRNA (adenosine(37)-N6)-dimethylallyltransferase MiaA [Eremococcus coleocola]|uniref:tRNA dimethylallyltransferase n=1 Tax=Eremococcus coleocola ACS-139-V-Col8 TaxID=908337 RepID=E4KNI6_9LACT|nr:tRNA (adenosine(37)-N6)-dimethylallyltransferase MiaA [Eremococcus coleocola]EFR31484.1 tRNA dimethylallyltransferase [Eremococcus coleocola ACS-139-V-Col8]
MSNKPSLLVIVGPTAVGKTQLSIHLAHALEGQVINGDSMQVYQGLDIGTGKIQAQEMEEVPHHLLDIKKPDQAFNASDFKRLAQTAIQEISQEGSLPILVGGTGLYIEGLLYDLEFGRPQSVDPTVRENLADRLEAEGSQVLWQELQQKDPQAAAKIPYQNSRRLIRALEVIETSGQLFSSQTHFDQRESAYNYLVLVLNRDRQKLYERINQRVDQMLSQGLEAEVKTLVDQAQGQSFQSLAGIGYKEWLPYFAGQVDYQSVVETIKRNSRRYAKRQLTWFRNRLIHPVWVDMDRDLDQILAELVPIIKEALGK